MSSKRDVEFLFEMGALRFQPRQWHRFFGIPFANITEHHFRVIWIALIIAAREGATNSDKIIKMALAHDIAESRTGDVDHMSRQYVVRNEALGIQDMLAGTAIEKEFLAVVEEYEARQTLEAKIVKDADNLEVDMELREQVINGVQLGETMKQVRADVGNTKLYTKTAKALFKQIRASDPHDWHLTSPRVRWNGGDWQKKTSTPKK